jgi:hypothetical protein
MVEPEEREPISWNGKCAAVYGHNFSESIIRNIRSWAKARGRRLVSIGYRNNWADEQWIDADPHEFAHFIAGASAVITNFFHGCVFALINEKPFVCETSEYRANKLDGLMKQIGGQRRLVDSRSDELAYENALDQPLSGDMLTRLDHLRVRSEEYLSTALGR